MRRIVVASLRTRRAPARRPGPAPTGSVVPVIVVRLADIDAAQLSGAGLPPSLAALLVGMYSRPGDLVVDLGDDAVIAGVCGAGGRRHTALTPSRLTEHLTGQAGLVLLCARLQSVRGPDQVRMVRAAARALAACGRLILAASGGPGNVDTAAVAARAGLVLAQRLVTVRAPIAGQPVSRHATPTTAAALRSSAHVRLHHDLLVFVTASHTSATPATANALA